MMELDYCENIELATQICERLCIAIGHAMQIYNCRNCPRQLCKSISVIQSSRSCPNICSHVSLMQYIIFSIYRKFLMNTSELQTFLNAER